MTTFVLFYIGISFLFSLFIGNFIYVGGSGEKQQIHDFTYSNTVVQMKCSACGAVLQENEPTLCFATTNQDSYRYDSKLCFSCRNELEPLIDDICVSSKNAKTVYCLHVAVDKHIQNHCKVPKILDKQLLMDALNTATS